MLKCIAVIDSSKHAASLALCSREKEKKKEREREREREREKKNKNMPVGYIFPAVKESLILIYVSLPCVERDRQLIIFS